MNHRQLAPGFTPGASDASDDGGRTADRLLIVGNREGTNVGGSFERAAAALGLEAHLLQASAASRAPRWVVRACWHILGHRPPRLRRFSQAVVAECRRVRPRLLLATGLAPIDARALRAIGGLGVQRINYLTDDPWSPVCRSRWFFRAVREYDAVFSVRRANLDDLRRHGCRSVEYLLFAYDPQLFHAEPAASDEGPFASDVLFAGGADSDRIPYLAALLRDGRRLALYGSYWERYAETRAHTRGQADPATLRQAIASARVVLGLVRRANRDGHSMRSFEVPAVGGCLLAEDTEEHRELLGSEGEACLYFGSVEEMRRKLDWLLANEDERLRMARAGHARITGGSNTYADRLQALLAPRPGSAVRDTA